MLGACSHLHLVTCTDLQGDVDKFTGVIAEYDSMSRLDQWKTTLLLRAKKRCVEKDDSELL